MTRRLSRGVPIRVGGVEIVPIVSVRIDGHVIGSALTALAAKEPVAVIVRTREGERVLDLEGREVRMEDLVEEPGAAGPGGGS